jgi:hypothetical protein
MTDSTFHAAEQATDQMREFGERAAETGRSFSRLYIDAYEQAVNGFVDFEQKAAEAAPVDWMKTAIGAHASLVGEVNSAYVRAVRSVLS